MSKRYDLVIFDWEGTLGDTLGLVLNCVAVEARRLGFGELDEALARQYVDLGLVNAVRKTFPDLTFVQHEQLLESVQRSVASHHKDVFLIPGATDLLVALKSHGTALAVATNKGCQSLQRALALTELDSYFSATRCAGRLPPKPAPDMLEEILEELDVGPERALMVGDSVSDMEMAKQLGVDAVGVNFYHKNPAALLEAGAIKVFDDYPSLAVYLLKL